MMPSSAVADVERRLAELHAVRACLWNDRDDSRVLSELVAIEEAIRTLEQEVGT